MARLESRYVQRDAAQPRFPRRDLRTIGDDPISARPLLFQSYSINIDRNRCVKAIVRARAAILQGLGAVALEIERYGVYPP
jgi:hypothetical protein